MEPASPGGNRHSGYLVGGTSPFGTRKGDAGVHRESILQLPRIAINGGRRVQIDPCCNCWATHPVRLGDAGALRAKTVARAGAGWQMTRRKGASLSSFLVLP